MTAKPSANGQKVLDALSGGPRTDDELARMTGLDDERLAAALAALSRRGGLIGRRFIDGEMRYVRV